MARCTILVAGFLVVSGLSTASCSSTPEQVFATDNRHAEHFYSQHHAALVALARECRSVRPAFLFADDGGRITLVEHSLGVNLQEVLPDHAPLQLAYRRLGWSASHVQRLRERMRAAECSRIRCTGDFSQPMAVPPLELQCRIYPAVYFWKSGAVYFDLFAENLTPESLRWLNQHMQAPRLGAIISPQATWHYKPS